MLVTLEQMLKYLGLEDCEEDMEEFLIAQIELVSEVVEMYCKRKFAVATYIESFYREEFNGPENYKRLPLYMYPVISVTSIKEKEKTADMGSTFEDFRVNKPTGIITANPGCGFFNSYGGNLLEVTYSAGYTSIPKPVLEVVYSVVKERYQKRVNGVDISFGSDVQRVSIPGVISLDYDFTLDNNSRQNAFGSILGANTNTLDMYRSSRAVYPEGRLRYAEQS